MLELAESLLAALDSGRRLAVATVIGVDGSAPRALGTSMAVDADGRVIGSISGGCVEGAVYDACNRVLETGAPEVCEFGFSDDDAFAVGLACGGRLRVFVQELGLPDARNALPASVRGELERARDGRAAGLALVLDGEGAGTGRTGADGAAGVRVRVDGPDGGRSDDSRDRRSGVAASEDRRSGVAASDDRRSDVAASDDRGSGLAASDDRRSGVAASDDAESAGDGVVMLAAHTTAEENAVATAFSGRGSGTGRLGASVRHRVTAELVAGIHSGRSVRRRVDCEGESVEVVLLVSAPPPRLIVFGAVDFSVALSNAARLLGYRVTVCDARPVFATPERFPGAEVVNQWPSDYLLETEVDERTVLCILTHDDKFDVPLIEAALSLPVAYVGAMGSRKTHERRLAALRDRGIPEEALASLHSPIGLDLGASSPEETAVSILAEVLAERSGSTGAPLRTTRGAIHRDVVATRPGGAE
ncbi:XdhC/CoxI family protein [Herbiconiux sp. 11R-BC]|uniref:XdhC family protein n=1 Tax=Herbiconiux sp. 11R-BC TaxID=3111637 RepID=UPI003C02286C